MLAMSRYLEVVAVGAFALVVGCGGIAIVDPDGGSGGATASSTTGATTSVSSTGTGTTGCTDHADCPGGVCVFATGTCAASCAVDACDPCSPGTVCEPCA